MTGAFDKVRHAAQHPSNLASKSGEPDVGDKGPGSRGGGKKPKGGGKKVGGK